MRIERGETDNPNGDSLLARAGHWVRKELWLFNENMPPELRTAEVVLSEQEVECTVQVPLFGKVDQVYRTRSGLLVPVDSKLRNRMSVKPADQVQLSTYGYILRHNPEYKALGKVADTGYIRFQSTGGSVVYQPVRLISDSTIEAIYYRWHALRHGKVSRVKYNWGSEHCAKCTNFAVCKGNIEGGK